MLSCNEPDQPLNWGAGLRWLLAVLLLLPVRGGSADSEPAVAKPTYHASLAAACDAAAINQGMVLLIFGAEWCGPCKLLKKNTLGSEEFHERGGAVRIFEVNVDLDEKTARAYGVSAVPSLFLLSPDGKIISRASGYMEVEPLMKWIAEGRERMTQGQWEGVAPGGKLAELSAKAGTEGLDKPDLERLVALLDQTDPAERLSASRLLLAQRERAVPVLIPALTNAYLGVRIAAAECLQKLSPDIPPVDPWLSPAELAGTVSTLTNWWAQTGKLPPATEARPLDATSEASIKSALDELGGNDPVQRTEAMSTLVSYGAAVLPKLRDAIKKSEAKSDTRTIALLEDVFWAILIPDVTERRAHVRTDLARGASTDRQAAAARLGRAGRDAIPALAELANDTDPLVAESAVRALSGIGGKDSIAAMAALLKANDSNLRVTAAQALGKTKNPEAAKALLTVVKDANEIVVCTALASLEEVFSRLTGPNAAKEKSTPEIVAALKTCLSDSRWRVRAATAEVVGKMQIRDLVDDLQKLLKDPDGFVVKNTLVALQPLGSMPAARELAALAKRLPGLRGDAVAIMIQSGSDESVTMVNEMYDAAGVEEQLGILTALAHSESRGERGSNDPWKPLLLKAAASKEARLRQATADVLAFCHLQEAAELVGPLLGDQDPETRAAAANVVLGILAGKRRFASRMGGIAAEYVDEASSRVQTFRSSSNTPKTNQVYATPTQIAAWHDTLSRYVSSNFIDFRIGLAFYVTGDPKTGLPVVLKFLNALHAAGLKQLARSPGISVLVRKLPWPEGRPVLEKFCAFPPLCALAALETDQAHPEIKAFLLDTVRFQKAVEPASGEELISTLQFLMGGGGSYGSENQRRWSLVRLDEPAQNIAGLFLTSTNAACRAAGINVLGRLAQPSRVPDFLTALHDPNPWVRASAIQAVAHAVKDRTALETNLGPMLGDTNFHAAQMAALALLEPEVRQVAGVPAIFSSFVFDGKTIAYQSYTYTSESEDRPLAVLDTKPPFLADVKKRLAGSDPQQIAPFALLLAQYGDFDGLARLARHASEESEDEFEEFEAGSLTDVVLAAIGLSHDPKYLPLLRNLMDKMPQEYQLRKILKAMRGMSGPEARALRLEINKRIRVGSNQPIPLPD